MPCSVYIMTNRRNGTLYVGVTRSPSKRMGEHRSGTGSEFVRTHGLDRLVYAESVPTALEVIAHEKRLKKWRRTWKLDLIDKVSPGWDDLTPLIHLD